jgi:hypothetical protein
MESTFNKAPSPERGKSVSIVLKFIRHGERDLAGNLTDYGRSVTRDEAKGSPEKDREYDAIKAVGSNAGPKKEGMGRSLESAHIYAEELAGEDVLNPREHDLLSYESMTLPVPYDHAALYNSLVPANFNELPDIEKAAAAKAAQEAVLDHMIGMKSPEAEAYKKEAAAQFAKFIAHYADMTKRLKGGSKVLLPSGTHGGTMEWLLQQALVMTSQSGEQKIGFDRIEEIGGAFVPSEAYNVAIATDKEGNLTEMTVSFDSPNRPQGKMHLDQQKLKELVAFYNELHPEKDN